MNILELLKNDHKVVDELFAKILSVSPNAENERTEECFVKLSEELELHTEGEETILYPVLLKFDETKELIAEAYEEHDIVNNLLAELEEMPSTDTAWLDKVKELQANVEHHVREEEDELFPKVEKLLDVETLEKMGVEMQAIKDQAQTEESEEVE